MTAKKTILTYTGLKALESELENLKVVKRKEVAQKIKEAREQGDLSENAEYDAAKDEQRDIEARIEEIEKILADIVMATNKKLPSFKHMTATEIRFTEFEKTSSRKIKRFKVK